MSLLEGHRETVDISLGGVRVYSDDRYAKGSLVKMEFFVQDGPHVTYTAEVVWVDRLPLGSPAKYDVGLKFVDLHPAALAFLQTVLSPDEG